MTQAQKIGSVSILGVPVSLITMKVAVAAVLGWVGEKNAQYICVRDVHGLMWSLKNPEMMEIQRQAGMVTPDGVPLVWVAKLRGHKNIGRVCGADFLENLCDASQAEGIRHFFYGGKEGIADLLAQKLTARFPRLQIAGTYSPPFRALSEQEDQDITQRIIDSGAQIVWVGISTPKQEFWMRDHVGKIPGATLVGIGAAFDFHSGAVARAPRWMQRSGLEWLHRLASEPRRLWRRYLVMAPAFVWAVFKEQIALIFTRRSKT